MSKALDTARPSSAMIGKPGSRAAHGLDVGLPFLVILDAVDGHADDLGAALGPFIGELRATAPNSVVQTGVKSFGWLNRIAQLSPIQSCRAKLP
jgi:hypothetical protein